MVAPSQQRMHVVVAGCGPAGRWLAAALAERGLDVAIVSPTWHRPWPNRYAGWADELAAWDLPFDVEFDAADVYVPEQRRVDRRYVRVDRDAFRAQVDARLARVPSYVARVARVDPNDARVHLDDGRSIACDVVVDATGRGHIARPSGSATRFQTAYGVEIDVNGCRLPSDAMTLMDFRAVRDAAWEVRPSFLYAMPLSGRRWFFEETILVGGPMRPESLRSTLAARLAALGVDLDRATVHDEERCVIPMDTPPLDAGAPIEGGEGLPGADRDSEGSAFVVPFGASAGYVHPATGYSLGTTLRRGARVADAIADVVARRPAQSAAILRDAVSTPTESRLHRVYGFGGEILSTMGSDDVQAFFRAFFALPADKRDRFLAGTLPRPELASAMWGVFVRTSMPVRGILAGAGMRHASLLWDALARRAAPAASAPP